MKKRILIVSDNVDLINAFNLLIENHPNAEVTYSYSYNNPRFLTNTRLTVKVIPINIKEQWQILIYRYDIIFSLHCKQLFPAELIKQIKCINVHPGFNPYNRGWFPQVFSIINDKKAGATIHEIDEQLDHGNIIARKEVEIVETDTSLTAYRKIQQAEIDLLKDNLDKILSGDYTKYAPEEEGNVNLKKDFTALCKINLEKKLTMREAINYLRSMTHGNYKNAYFIDKNGDKVFITVQFEKE